MLLGIKLGLPPLSDTRSDNPRLCSPTSGVLPGAPAAAWGLARVPVPCTEHGAQRGQAERVAGQEEPRRGPGSGVLPGAEQRGRISSHVSAMLILFIHRRVMLHPPGVTPLIHVRLVNRPNPQIRSSARVWREKRMGWGEGCGRPGLLAGLSMPGADGRAGGEALVAPGWVSQVPRVSGGLFSTGRDGEWVTPHRPPPLARSGAAG